MKMKYGLLTAVCAVAFAAAGMAQVQLNASGSYLKATGDNNDASLWGGGIGAKFFLSGNLAVGGDLHAFPRQSSSIKVGNTAYTSSDLVSNVSASVDFLLHNNTAPIQPYLGANAGVSFNNQTVTYTNESTQVVENKNNQSFFLLAPKLGLNIGLGQSFGLFGEARYNFTFGDGNPKSISFENVPNPVTTQPVSKYFTFDAGIYIRLERAGKN